jgi:hypothetical protein
MILHLLFRFSIEGDTKMCVTDYCPHSYSYRMILIRTHFIFISLARFCIWHTVLELTIELVCIFDTIKRAKASGSFHCCLLVGRIWYLYRHLLVRIVELSVASNLLGVCLHTLSTCFQWYVVLVFTVELVRIFVTINRATSWSLHCCLLLEKSVSVSVSSSSIERQVLLLEKLVSYHHSLVRTTVRCLKPD